jgi:hypothetical protein
MKNPMLLVAVGFTCKRAGGRRIYGHRQTVIDDGFRSLTMKKGANVVRAQPSSTAVTQPTSARASSIQRISRSKHSP